MEALSPRDVNAHIRVKQSATKQKPATAKLGQKEKDHPPPPPADVREPPSSDRKNGALYHTGALLGKGGFAICYEGRLAGTKQKYALKIVKSQMPQKKMEQKVRQAQRVFFIFGLTQYPVPNRAPDPFQDEACQHRPISPSLLLRKVYLHCAGTLPQWILDGYGQEEEIHH